MKTVDVADEVIDVVGEFDKEVDADDVCVVVAVETHAPHFDGQSWLMYIFWPPGRDSTLPHASFSISLQSAVSGRLLHSAELV